MRVEDEFLDALQNIEAIIVHYYRTDPDLLDYDVEDVLKALSSIYYAEQSGRKPRPFNFSERGEKLYLLVNKVCESLLGREQFLELDIKKAKPLSLQDLDKCLKRLLKSVNRWNKLGGRKGYLDYIDQFM